MFGIDVWLHSGAWLCGSCYRRLVAAGPSGKEIINNSNHFGEYLHRS